MVRFSNEQISGDISLFYTSQISFNSKSVLLFLKLFPLSDKKLFFPCIQLYRRNNPKIFCGKVYATEAQGNLLQDSYDGNILHNATGIKESEMEGRTTELAQVFTAMRCAARWEIR